MAGPSWDAPSSKKVKLLDTLHLHQFLQKRLPSHQLAVTFDHPSIDYHPSCVLFSRTDSKNIKELYRITQGPVYISESLSTLLSEQQQPYKKQFITKCTMRKFLKNSINNLLYKCLNSKLNRNILYYSQNPSVNEVRLCYYFERFVVFVHILHECRKNEATVFLYSFLNHWSLKIL